MKFRNDQERHQHSLQTLNVLYEYDDFMASIGTLADFGCGSGLDLEWWATRTTRDNPPAPLNIKCTGVDLHEQLAMAHKYRNITYQKQDFQDPILIHKRKFDVIWCHDAFQYVTHPFETLANWWQVLADNGMMIIVVPQTTNVESRTLAFDQPPGCYFNWTLVSLIHTLAVSGFDCNAGFFKKNIDDPWLHAVVYKSTHAPMDPKKISWFQLAELGLLPKTVVESLESHGTVRQRDLVLPWLDHSLTWYGSH